MNCKVLLPLSLVALAFATAPVYAQDDDDSAASGRRVIYKSKTEIDFEAVDVAGELVKPQGALLLDRKRGSFNPLIKLRADFNDEMDASVDEVK
ncbi:MAG: hypothetical protein ABIO70_20500 [Pseudomonadota bacterium]